jgi:hypothetical protein
MTALMRIDGWLVYQPHPCRHRPGEGVRPNRSSP